MFTAVDPATGPEVAAWCAVIIGVLGLLAAVFTPILGAIFRRLGGIQKDVGGIQTAQAVLIQRLDDLPCQDDHCSHDEKKEIAGKS